MVRLTWIIGGRGGEDTITTRILIRERGRQQNQSRRRCGDGSKGWGDAMAGFEAGGRGYKLRRQVASRSKARKCFSPKVS